MAENNHETSGQGLAGYGVDGPVPEYLAKYEQMARESDLEDVPDLDTIADTLGIKPLTASDIPGVRERESKSGSVFEVWHGKTEEGKRRYIGTFTTLAEAARAKEIAEGVARDATMLLTEGLGPKEDEA